MVKNQITLTNWTEEIAEYVIIGYDSIHMV